MTSSNDGRSDLPPADGAPVTDTDRLLDLRDRPLAEHADVFGQLHAELQAALADIDHA